MTPKEFESVAVGDTVKGPSFNQMLEGTLIIKDDDSVLILAETERGMMLSTCRFERLELVERSKGSEALAIIKGIRPDLQGLVDISE